MGTTHDPVSDLLTRIRNAKMARLRFIELKTSKMLIAIVKILKKHGFVEGYLVREEKPQAVMRVYLRYGAGRKPAIEGIQRVSKPGQPRYVGYRQIPRLLNGLGRSILSTSKGILDDEEAREQKVGGELLCQVW